jgi:hypothetical protein
VAEGVHVLIPVADDLAGAGVALWLVARSIHEGLSGLRTSAGRIGVSTLGELAFPVVLLGPTSIYVFRHPAAMELHMEHLFRDKPHVLIDANGSEHRIIEWKAREQTPGLRSTLRRLLGSSFDPVLSFVHQVSPKELAERAMTIALEHELYLDGWGDRPQDLRKAVAEVTSLKDAFDILKFLSQAGPH